MITEEAVLLLSAGTYAIFALVLGFFTLRLEGEAKYYSGLFVGFIGLAAITTVLSTQGIGTVDILGGTLDIPNFLNDMIGYTGIFTVVALLAGATLKLALMTGGVMFIMRLVFEIPNAELGGDSVVLPVAVTIIGGYLALVYLLVKPVYAQSQAVSARRRLLYWKTRNIVLFVFGFLLVYAVIFITGGWDDFTRVVANEHIDLLIRVLPALLVIVNADKLSD